MTVVAVTLLVLPVMGASAASALGSLRAQGIGTVSASSGTWGAVATTAGAPPYTSAALTLTFARNGSKAPAPQYVWIVNTGTLALTSLTTTVSSTVTGKAEVCSTTWNETTGACSGTVTTLDTTTAGATSTALSLAAGARVRVKASLTAALSATTTLTVSLAVPRAGARARTTTSS